MQRSRLVLSVATGFTVGRDAEHNTTVGANAALLLLLVHVALVDNARVYAGYYFFLSAHVRTATARYRTLTTQQQSALL